MLKKISTVTVVLSCCILLIGLALMAYLGLYNRYWSDDWCYNRDFKSLGVLGTVNTYFFTGEDARRGYSTNRYSLTLLSGLLYLPGVLGTQILAGLIIILWVGGLLFVLLNLPEGYIPFPKSIAFLCAFFLLYYVLYLSPQRFQILYWRSGVHYSFTIIMELYLIGLILSQTKTSGPSILKYYLIAPLAFVAGGLSEIGCVYLFTIMTLFLLAALYWKRRGAAWAVKSYQSILIAFISLFVAMIVLIVSPSNSRADTLPVRPTSWPLVPVLSAEFSFNFIVDSIKSLPIPHLVFILAFVAISVLSAFLAPNDQSQGFKKTWSFLLVIPLIVFVLIAAVQAPGVRFYSAPPDPRGQSLSRFTMLAGLAVMAWMIGKGIFVNWQKQALAVLALVTLATGMFYTIRLIKTNYAELPGFVQRAQLWDERDSAIRSAVAQGEKMLEVPVIDTHEIAVQDIMRSKDMNGQWVSTCGSDFYGLDAIKAGQP